jgi:23S rRNA (cytidine1920-2'-O)/16S rRNA (cytidine1409-2'-O)-methyltransferase
MGVLKASRADRDRLDKVLVKRGLIKSRQMAQAFIMEGKVWVDGERVDKSGVRIAFDAEVVINGEQSPYVSRGGAKLEKALDCFNIEVSGKHFLDVGASTGGFTDCLLQRGAAMVYAVDVGYGQLAWKIRSDKRVISLERSNIRYLSKETFQDELDGAVIDVSFISLKKVIPKVIELIRCDGEMIALIKPQFEVGKGEVGKDGVVKDDKKHKEVIDDISSFAFDQTLQVVGFLESPLLGPKGNKEFFMYLKK